MSDREIFEAIITAKHNGQTVLLATVVRAQGSVPRHAGAKMLLYPDGTFKGTIGGGEMESRMIAEASAIFDSSEPVLLHYDLADPARGDPGVCGGQVDIFLEPIMPDPTVLVIGCGHVGQAVADLAHWLGFYVIVTDDREDLCNPTVIPQADEHIVTPPEEIGRRVNIHERTYIAAVTRGVPLDVAMLPQLLDTPAPYIGVMGSRRRWATAVSEMKEKGVEEISLRRIHAPIGLELNAETPREIAVSILAEIMALRYGGTGEPMRWPGPAEQAQNETA
jgi:xanthine dehydrogenase accessory factor